MGTQSVHCIYTRVSHCRLNYDICGHERRREAAEAGRPGLFNSPSALQPHTPERGKSFSNSSGRGRRDRRETEEAAACRLDEVKLDCIKIIYNRIAIPELNNEKVNVVQGPCILIRAEGCMMVDCKHDTHRERHRGTEHRRMGLESTQSVTSHVGCELWTGLSTRH